MPQKRNGTGRVQNEIRSNRNYGSSDRRTCAGRTAMPQWHDSSIPPRHPALIFVACHHYGIDATWNEFCITCGVRHAPFMIYRDFHRMDGKAVGPKNYCGYCGAKMVSRRASR